MKASSLIWTLIIIIAVLIIYILIKGSTSKTNIKELEKENAKLKEKIVEHNKWGQDFLKTFKNEINDICKGREWLADRISYLLTKMDMASVIPPSNKLQRKKVTDLYLEKAKLIKENELLNQQISIYKERFPFIKRFNNEIQNDSITIDDLIKKEEYISKRLSELKSLKSELETDISEIKGNFNKSFIKGRQWLSNMIAEAKASVDEARAKILLEKKNPAPSAAEQVREIRNEKQNLQRELTFLKYQLQSYKEYFPDLEEYEEDILEEVPGITDLTESDENNIDTVYKYLSVEEYRKLSTAQRNQLALNRYLNNLNKYGVGRLYEMQLGFDYESKGWIVTYFGITEQLKDMGRDLICRKNDETHIVQAKCWSKEKLIHEKHLFQLFGTAFEYQHQHPKEKVHPVFITSTSLSPVAKHAAKLLGIEYQERQELNKNIPVIKCNISKSGEKIYHLPFDQMYNRTIIEKNKGEFYASTVAEAEARGFRRAMKHIHHSS